VVTPGSPTKNPYSPVASNLSKAFKGASFGGRKSTGERNASLKKEGKLCVQVLYPGNDFADGVSFTTLYIKVVQYKGRWVVHVWYCNKKIQTDAFKKVLNITKDVDIGSEWLNYVINIMVGNKTRDTSYGSGVQKLRSDKWPVTDMAVYLKNGDTQKETVAWVQSVAECVMTYVSDSVGEGGELYYPFEEAFHK
jgi:hypothetical protein